MIFSPLRLTRVLQRYLGNLVDGLGADGDMLADIESAVEFLDKKEKEEADAARLEAEAWWKAKVDAAKFRDEVETTEKRANRWAGKEKEAEDAKNAKAEADRIDAERVAVEEERLRKARESAERAEQILERSRSARANADAARRTAVTAREEAEEAAIAVARGERERIASDAAQERALRAEAEADSLDKVAKAIGPMGRPGRSRPRPRSWAMAWGKSTGIFSSEEPRHWWPSESSKVTSMCWVGGVK